jgi:hypothetical protein
MAEMVDVPREFTLFVRGKTYNGAFFVAGEVVVDGVEVDPMMLRARRTASLRSTKARIGAVVLVLVVFGRVSFVGEGGFVAAAVVGDILVAGGILDGRGIETRGDAGLTFGDGGCGGIAIGLLWYRLPPIDGEILVGDVIGTELGTSVGGKGL